VEQRTPAFDSQVKGFVIGAREAGKMMSEVKNHRDQLTETGSTPNRRDCYQGRDADRPKLDGSRWLRYSRLSAFAKREE